MEIIKRYGIIVIALGMIFIALFDFKMKADNTETFDNFSKDISGASANKVLEIDGYSVLLEELYNKMTTPKYLTYKNINDFKDIESLKKYMYVIESDTYVDENDLDVDKLLAKDLTVDFTEDEAKVLIFHTHSQERFIDSSDSREDSIVGVGDELRRILEENGIKTIHDDGQYDLVDGELKISGAYERMEKSIEKILKENPSIEVCIDLHRDSLPSNKYLIWDNDGVATAQIMYFNGMSRLYKDGVVSDMEWLENSNLEENLAFSMQMKLLSDELYPEFTRKNYIRAYRYSLHMRGKSLLIEVGSDLNTVEESYNAMKPLAEILIKTLKGDTSSTE